MATLEEVKERLDKFINPALPRNTAFDEYLSALAEIIRKYLSDGGSEYVYFDLLKDNIFLETAQYGYLDKLGKLVNLKRGVNEPDACYKLRLHDAVEFHKRCGSWIWFYRGTAASTKLHPLIFINGLFLGYAGNALGVDAYLIPMSSDLHIHYRHTGNEAKDAKVEDTVKEFVSTGPVIYDMNSIFYDADSNTSRLFANEYAWGTKDNLTGLPVPDSLVVDKIFNPNNEEGTYTSDVLDLGDLTGKRVFIDFTVESLFELIESGRVSYDAYYRTDSDPISILNQDWISTWENNEVTDSIQRYAQFRIHLRCPQGIQAEQLVFRGFAFKIFNESDLPGVPIGGEAPSGPPWWGPTQGGGR